MTNNLKLYHSMLTGRGLAVGDQVVCLYRTPTPHQRWLHPWHVGVILEPTDNPGDWNGTNSEAYYCARFLYVPVRYLPGPGSVGFTQRDQLASLNKIPGDPLSESPFFGSDDAEAIRIYQFACRVGMGAQFAEESQAAWHAMNQAMKQEVGA